MKLGQVERLNKYCGIAYMTLEDNEKYFIVYGDYMIGCKGELGYIIGKGKTIEKALTQALKIYSTYASKLESYIYKNIDDLGIDKYCFLSHISKIKPVHPIKDYECEYDSHPNSVKISDSNKYINAHLGMDEDGPFVYIP